MKGKESGGEDSKIGKHTEMKQLTRDVTAKRKMSCHVITAHLNPSSQSPPHRLQPGMYKGKKERGELDDAGRTRSICAIRPIIDVRQSEEIWR